MAFVRHLDADPARRGVDDATIGKISHLSDSPQLMTYLLLLVVAKEASQGQAGK